MENSNDEKILKKRLHNQTNYKIYKMISWDLLFYYAISFLFLTQEKGLTTSEIIFADAFYPLFKLLFQFPCTILVEKLGKRKSLILANLCITTYVLIVIGLNNQFQYIISNIFCALGFIIKGIAETNVLFDSIEDSEHKRTTFSKIDGFASSLYYYFDAITSVIAGFLFVINPYIPMGLCLIFTILATLLAFNFEEIYTEKTQNSLNEHSSKSTSSIFKQLKYYINDLKQAFKFIAKSKRLRALIIFYATFSTLLSVMTTVRRSLLKELNVPNEYFGVLFAIWGLIAGFSVNSSTKIQKRHGNHTLSFLSSGYIFSLIFSGLVSILYGLPPFFVYFIVLTMISLQYIIKGPFQTLIHRYLGSFSNTSLQTKISSASMFIENITCTIITFMVSFLTDHATSAQSTLILGIIFGILILLILNYMKTRVGLKPEEYSDSDIKFKEVY